MTITTALDTLIIFDWDDTLFPTNLLNDSTLDYQDIDNRIFKTLNYINNYGTIIIITNAAKVWIDNCLNDLPMTKKFLYDKEIISAQDLYKGKYPAIYWKIEAFIKIMNLEKYKNYKNIISIGDGVYEYKALIALANYFYNIDNKIFKTVKLVKYPTYKEYKYQLLILMKEFYKIITKNKNMDLIMKEIKNKKKKN
jgi:hypothetical protein